MSNKSQNIYRGVGVKIKLSESTDSVSQHVPNELQLFKAGVYYHDSYGKIEITPDILKKMAFNFNEKVRGIDLALDYKHDSEGEAAAWFEEVYTKENDTELWFKPRWTPQGKETILSEKYKYISPDFTLSYIDNEKLTNHGPVLMGAGLTNRPFIKRMAPIILSEEYKMDELQKLKEENALLKAENEKLKAAASGKPEMEVEMKEKDKMAYAEKDKQLSEKDAEIKKLKEEKVIAEKENQFNIMLSEGKAVPAQKESFMKGDMIEFAKNAGNLNFSEKGKGGDPVVDKKGDAQDEVIKLAEKKVNENKKLDFSDAVKMVLSENPELNKEYQKKFN